MTTKITASLVAAATIALAPMAHANAELELISGATTVSVTAANVGSAYVYSGSVGGWSLSVSTGTFLGASGLDINSVSTSGGTSSPLEILWSSSFASPVSGNYLATVGGTLNGGLTVAFSSYVGSTILSTGTQLTPTITFSTSPYSGSSSGTASPSATYLTEEALISNGQTSGAQASFDFSVNAVPDGGMTLALLGGSMAGLTLIRSKINKRK